MALQKRSAAALAGASGAGKAKNDSTNGNSAAAQRQRILQSLRFGPVTTFSARRDLDIAHPAARVMELRAAGYGIVTHWSIEDSSVGTQHRVARYVLMAEAEGVRP